MSAIKSGSIHVDWIDKCSLSHYFPIMENVDFSSHSFSSDIPVKSPFFPSTLSVISPSFIKKNIYSIFEVFSRWPSIYVGNPKNMYIFLLFVDYHIKRVPSISEPRTSSKSINLSFTCLQFQLSYLFHLFLWLPVYSFSPRQYLT